MARCTPDPQSFAALAALPRPAVVPVWREVLSDLNTPVSAFLRAVPAEQRDYAFLLESVEGGRTWARYSILGFDPAWVVRAQGHRCELLRGGALLRAEERADPLTLLEELLGRYTPRSPTPLPFGGGAVGWLGYDAARWWERLAPTHPAGSGQAWTMVFAVPQSLLIFDNVTLSIRVVRLVFLEPQTPAEAAYAEAQAHIERVVRALRGPLPPPTDGAVQLSALTPNQSQARFEQAVAEAQALIHAGDCIQVVLSQRFDFTFDGEPFDIYRALRAHNPSPYMFHLRYPEQQVVGASPEVLVRVRERRALLAPIAGTARRGADEDEDACLAEALLADPKERAEHVMLVDLGRNDLGRVAAPGTVRVSDLMRIERYSHVMHIVSTVEAELAAGRTGFDAVRAAFPAGTLSGAPKVRAMEIIDALEPDPRGLYGGAVGFFGFNGDLDLCIAIRTAVGQHPQWSLQVGAGVVADSVPSAEYQETLNKAAGMRKALLLAGSRL